MEKRKDIDMLRFYGGDIHQKNKEGEYVITNNLVNPKNKEDVLWGDRDAYRTLNALWSMQVNAIRRQHLLVKKILTEIYEIYFQKIILFSFHLIR